MPKTAVVALGGNAFTRAGQTGSYEEQSRNALAMARSVLAIRRAGWKRVTQNNSPCTAVGAASTGFTPRKLP